MGMQEFIANVKKGMAKANRYAIILTNPKVMQNDLRFGGESLKNILLFCSQVQLPGLEITTSQIKTFGETREMPSGLNYQQIQVEFYVDQKLLVKSYFDTWFQNIQQGNLRTFNYYDDIICNQMHIQVLDIQDNTKYQVTLYEVYPVILPNNQLAADQNGVLKLAVTLNYKYWRASQFDVGSKNESSTSPDIFLQKDNGVMAVDFNTNKDFNFVTNSFLLAEIQNIQTGVTNPSNNWG